MQKITIIRTSAIALATVSLAVAALDAKKPSTEDNQSVAWYTANIREAKAKNQMCHDNPEIASGQDCLNALHALELSFGINRP